MNVSGRWMENLSGNMENGHQEELAILGHRCVAMNSPVRNRSCEMIGTKSEPGFPVVTEF